MKPNLRTLFITKEVPYPPKGGVSLRNWQDINILMKHGSVAVFTASNWNPKETSLPGVAIWKHCNVEQQRSGREKLNRRLWWLYPHRHPDADWAYSNSAAQELDKFMTEFKPNMVILSEVWLYPYLKVVKRHPCKIIFDNHNVEASLWEQNLRGVQGLKSRLKAKLLISHLKGIEGNFSRQADQVWVCSDGDALLTQQLYGQVSPLYTIPNGINVAQYDDVRSGKLSPPNGLEKTSRNIIFLGQLSYPPNKIAAELLIKQIYPQLKAFYPDCRLLLVGRNPTPLLLDATKNDVGIIVTGSVPDVRPYLAAASLMVVPLRQGGGTRLKILEAFAAGCPVVSTAKGAEGLKARDGEHLLIRDTVEEIVNGVVQLWSEVELGDKLARSAYELVQTEYSWEAVGQRVEKALVALF
jgi:glycosyltransferase involved in cell wall biosynthesis